MFTYSISHYLYQCRMTPQGPRFSNKERASSHEGELVDGDLEGCGDGRGAGPLCSPVSWEPWGRRGAHSFHLLLWLRTVILQVPTVLEGGPRETWVTPGPVHLPVPFCLSLCMYLRLAGRMVKGQGKKTVKKLQTVLLYLVTDSCFFFSLRQTAGCCGLWLAPCLVLVNQSCLTLCDRMDCSLPGSSVHGIPQASIRSNSLLQGIFPTQGSNLGQFGAYEGRNAPARHPDTHVSKDWGPPAGDRTMSNPLSSAPGVPPLASQWGGQNRGISESGKSLQRFLMVTLLGTHLIASPSEDIMFWEALFITWPWVMLESKTLPEPPRS